MAVIGCKICGGTLVRSGSFDVCEYCGNKWEIDRSNEIQAVDRANAWASVRDGDFEKASRQFEEILLKEPDNHEAYWGRALAANGIIYVTDLLENKKVPTCNNITENSFLDHGDVQKAISLAPPDIQGSYEAQAKQIENIRVEWLEKAAKEPAYDVFLSYKDSDREKGIERTQDSIDAQDLYNALVAEGYKVFFSRISLRDKISEQYEPYIYNAIKTAKVMIVFGEKPEYFHSVWIKNEWSRFVTRIKNGEKHKNSLVVVYKNLNPGDLPVVLKSRQCLNASDMTFLSDLNRHIKRVLEQSPKTTQIEKIKIEGGKVGKKATTLNTNTIQIREIGQGAIAQTDINEMQMLDLVRSYLKFQQWKESIQMAETLLFDNPGFGEAIWYKLLAENRAAAAAELAAKLQPNDAITFATIEKVLDCSTRKFADEVLTDLYHCVSQASDEASAKLLQTILPYSFSNRQMQIDHAFQVVIRGAKYQSFCTLLTTLNPSQVEKYIQYYWDYAHSTKDKNMRHICMDKILEVDEGNHRALNALYREALEEATDGNLMTARLESLLRYAPNPETIITESLDWLSKNAVTEVHSGFAKQLLRYSAQDIEKHMPVLISLEQRFIQIGAFEDAEYILQLVMSRNPENTQLYWDACMIKARAKDEDSLITSRIPLTQIPEYTKYLSMLDEKTRMKRIKLMETQKLDKLLSNSTYREWFQTILADSIHERFQKEKVERNPGIIQQAQGGSHTVMLYRGGRVSVKGINYQGQRNVSGWYDIVAVAAGDFHTVGLTRSGRVYATGLNEDGQCDVEKWSGVVAIGATSNCTVGLKSDGTVLIAGSIGLDKYDLSHWKNVVSILVDNYRIFGLQSNGQVFAAGSLHPSSTVRQWKDIVAIYFDNGFSLFGLKADGTIITDGTIRFEGQEKPWKVFESAEVFVEEKLKQQEEALQEKRNQIQREIAAVQEEINNLSGIFSRFRRTTLTEKKTELEQKLKSIR